MDLQRTNLAMFSQHRRWWSGQDNKTEMLKDGPACIPESLLCMVFLFLAAVAASFCNTDRDV